MKKRCIFYCLILFVAVVSEQEAQAQKAKEERIQHTYFRKPLQKIEGVEKKWSLHLNLPFVNSYLGIWNTYQEDVKKAELEYEEAVKVYNSKTVGERVTVQLFDAEGYPTKKSVAPPPTRNDIPNLSEFVTSIKLEGFEKIEDGGVSVFIEAHDYEVTAEENYSGEAEKQRYKMLVYLKQPIRLKVSGPAGNVLYDQIVSETNSKSFYKTDELKKVDFDKYKNSSSYETWLASKKSELRSKNQAFTNNTLNSQFGYVWAAVTTSIYTGTGKNLDYSSLDSALLLTKHALQELKDNNSAATEKLNKAVVIWSSELMKLDSKDKNAPINAKVGAAILLNLATISIFLGNLDIADGHLTSIEGNDDFKGGDIKEAESLRKFLNDQRARQ